MKVLPWDFIAGGLELIGLYLIGQKKRSGFLITAIGCAVWIIVAISEQVYGLLLVVVPAIVLNIYNLVRWKNADKH